LDQCLALYPEMYQALVLKGFACHSMNHQEMAVKVGGGFSYSHEI